MNFERIKKEMTTEVEKGILAGCTCMCVKDGEELFYYETGYADVENRIPMKRDTIFRMYSMTKPVTSVAAMILIERGLLKQEDLVSNYLPKFKNPVVDRDGKLEPAKREITVKDLMCMVAGLTYPGDEGATCLGVKSVFDKMTDDLETLGEGTESRYSTVVAMNDLGEVPLAFSPAEHWNYSACADVLGAVIEVVSGQKLSDFMKENIFEPLGMEDTDFYVPKEKQKRLSKTYMELERKELPGGIQAKLSEYHGNHLAIQNRMMYPPVFESAGAGLASTIDDYMKFATMLINKGIYNGRMILKKETVEHMLTGQLTDEQQEDFFWDSLYGMTYTNLFRVMKWLDKTPHKATLGEYGWDGWLGCYVLNMPEIHASFLFMTQKTDAGTHPLTKRITNILYEELLEK